MKRIILPLVLCIGISAAFAGNNDKKVKKPVQSVSFTVTDTEQQSIAGAEVSIPALNIVAYTDMDGNFSADVPADFDGEIKVTFIAHEDKILKVSDLNEKSVTLTEE